MSTVGAAEVVVAQTIYGETRSNPEAANLRGRAVEVRDQAGALTTDAFDFAGNPIRIHRVLVKDYRNVIDWGVAASHYRRSKSIRAQVFSGLPDIR
jgi:hypothetical protein